MEKKTWSTHPILCVFLLYLFCTTKMVAGQNIPISVGVVLEMDDYGDMVLNCISMALDDFYKTWLVLTNCDSKGDVVGTAAAGQASFHMLSPFASRLFATREYARIITGGITDELISMNTSPIDSMLGVKPYVPPKTKELNDFTTWYNRRNNPRGCARDLDIFGLQGMSLAIGNPKYQETNISYAGPNFTHSISCTRFKDLARNLNLVTWNSVNSTEVEGYCIDVFDAVMKALPYEYIPFPTSDHNMVGDYNDLTYQVNLGNYDAVAGDVTIVGNRSSQYVDFTLPFTESGIAMIVPVEDMRKNSWVFLKPLTGQLWATIFGSFLFIGALVWVLEHHQNKDFQGSAWYQVGMILWFAFSTIVFAQREKVVSNLNRLVLIIWFMVVFIPTLSYTGFFEFVRVIWNSNNTTKVERYRIDAFNAVMASLPIGFLVEHQINKYFRHHFWHQLCMTMWFAFSAFIFSHRETVVQTRPGLW